jgi:hypothetical protein
MAASGDAAMNRVQSVLPPAYRLRGRLPVLQEMQCTLWLEHSMNLQKCRRYVRNNALRVAGQYAIHRSVGQMELRTVKSHVSAVGRDGRLARLSEPHCRRRGLYDQDLGYLSRIMAEIEAGPEADFQARPCRPWQSFARRAFTSAVRSTRSISGGKNVMIPDAHRTKASVVAGDQTPKAFSSSTVRA